jgi:hypothetical protein
MKQAEYWRQWSNLGRVFTCLMVEVKRTHQNKTVQHFWKQRNMSEIMYKLDYARNLTNGGFKELFPWTCSQYVKCMWRIQIQTWAMKFDSL